MDQIVGPQFYNRGVIYLFYILFQKNCYKKKSSFKKKKKKLYALSNSK